MIAVDDVVAPTLEVLGREANHQHQLVQQSEKSAVGFALLAGKALLEAQTLVVDGGWGAWLSQNAEMSTRRAALYMRIAYYADEVSDAQSLNEARQILTGLPAIDGLARATGSRPDRVRGRNAARRAFKRIHEARDLLSQAASIESNPARKEALWDAWSLVADAEELLRG
jgi:hypothetical protein